MQPSVGGEGGGSATEKGCGEGGSPFVFSGSACQQRMERRPEVIRNLANAAQFLQLWTNCYLEDVGIISRYCILLTTHYETLLLELLPHNS